jgi:DNA gyrase/topoisomerase IV subunit A
MARKDKNRLIEIKENIETNSLDEIMGEKYCRFMPSDVIQDRAIPDARDGLKAGSAPHSFRHVQYRQHHR